MIAEGFSRNWCPGEENCPTFKTSQNPDRTCQQCPRNLAKQKTDEIEGASTVLPWLRHVFWLYGLKQAGATFLLDELDYMEWETLMIFERVRNEIEREQYEKQRMREKIRSAQAQSKPVQSRRR